MSDGRADRASGSGARTLGRTYFAVQLNTPPIAPNKPPQDELLVVDVVPMTDFQIVEPPEDQQGQ